MTNAHTLTIGRRTFTVQVAGHQDMGRAAYMLTGEHGATYGTLRYHNCPERMFLVAVGRSFRMDPLGPVQFTDEDGMLAVAPSPAPPAHGGRGMTARVWFYSRSFHQSATNYDGGGVDQDTHRTVRTAGVTTGVLRCARDRDSGEDQDSRINSSGMVVRHTAEVMPELDGGAARTAEGPQESGETRPAITPIYTHCHGGGAFSSGGGCWAGEVDGWCECECKICSEEETMDTTDTDGIATPGEIRRAVLLALAEREQHLGDILARGAREVIEHLERQANAAAWQGVGQ